MDIEPLGILLNNSDNKKNVIMAFLNYKDKEKIENTDYEENNFYINDNIYCIKRNNLSLDIIGKIIYKKNNKMGIKLKNNIIVYININLYYLFIKNNNNNNNKKELMQYILNKLNNS